MSSRSADAQDFLTGVEHWLLLEQEVRLRSPAPSACESPKVMAEDAEGVA